ARTGPVPTESMRAHLGAGPVPLAGSGAQPGRIPEPRTLHVQAGFAEGSPPSDWRPVDVVAAAALVPPAALSAREPAAVFLLALPAAPVAAPAPGPPEESDGTPMPVRQDRWAAKAAAARRAAVATWRQSFA